jgi:hypothetical protein
MFTVLTDPGVVSLNVMEEDWSVTSILDYIASRPASEHVHALIDTGALITGMSNKEVAQYLLDRGMPWCEGVVFLDDADRKMILVRATRRVVDLGQCGIPLQQRFAFYDQIHTTGMDIQHALNAMAILTLGKDMTFRDGAQGAFRMRGIARGQRIQVLVIPEVRELIRRELTSAALPVAAPEAVKLFLQNIVYWLLINSMRSERIQYNQLCVQNVSNVWRKVAYRTLKDACEKFASLRTVADMRLLKGMAVFKEAVDYDVEHGAPKLVELGAELRELLEANSLFVQDSSAREVPSRCCYLVSSDALSPESEGGEERRGRGDGGGASVGSRESYTHNYALTEPSGWC